MSENPDDFYPENFTEDEKRIFDLGWTFASANLIEIWDGFKSQEPGRTEAFEKFDRFMSMVALKITGASNSDLAVVAALNGDDEMATYLREG